MSFNEYIGLRIPVNVSDKAGVFFFVFLALFAGDTTTLLVVKRKTPPTFQRGRVYERISKDLDKRERSFPLFYIYFCFTFFLM